MKERRAMILVCVFFTMLCISWQSPDSLNAEDETPGCLLFDIHSGEILTIENEELLLQGRSVGSMIKLFTVYALTSAGLEDKTFFCPESSIDEPSTRTCWYKPGHGNLRLATALAHSCNSYFRQWISGKNLSPVITLFHLLGLSRTALNMPGEINEEDLLGFTNRIRLLPINVGTGIAALFNGGRIYRYAESNKVLLPIKTMRVNEMAMSFLKDGMALCCASGTGSLVGKRFGADFAYVKTGTSAHQIVTESGEKISDSMATDGFCLVIYPARKPQFLCLTVVANGRGAVEAAALAVQRIQSHIGEAQ